MPFVLDADTRRIAVWCLFVQHENPAGNLVLEADVKLRQNEDCGLLWSVLQGAGFSVDIKALNQLGG